MARRRKYRNPVISRAFEMLVSTGIVYLLTPTLQSVLAPIQAKINAGAVNNGQTPTNNGLSAVANTLVQLTSNNTPTATTPVVQTPLGAVPVTAQVPLNTVGS